MILFIAFSAIYIVFLVWGRWHWGRITPHGTRRATDLSFSVVIPVRNEATNIAALLSDLDRQDYPKELFEVIVVDDSSEDDTMKVARETLAHLHLKHQLIDLAGLGVAGKKQAISAAVRQARHEVILATDGDCRLGPGWIGAYARAYASGEVEMVTGPVKMVSHGFFTQLQAVEFAGLIGMGAASLQSGNPTMCNGANLSYLRAAFLAVRGYEGNEEIASGDDEFLLQKIFRQFPGRASFLKDPDAVVSTPAKDTLSELLNQRKRWSSKWKFHKSYFIKLLALFVFFNYAVFLYALCISISSPVWAEVFLATFLARWFFLSLFISTVARFLGIPKAVPLALVLEIIYPFLVIFLGIASIFGHYSWKGRYYS